MDDLTILDQRVTAAIEILRMEDPARIVFIVDPNGKTIPRDEIASKIAEELNLANVDRAGFLMGMFAKEATTALGYTFIAPTAETGHVMIFSRKLVS